MNDFDLKKFLVENRLTGNSKRLTEQGEFVGGDVNAALGELSNKLAQHLLSHKDDLPLQNTRMLEKFLYDIVGSLKKFPLDLPRNPQVTDNGFKKFKEILSQVQQYSISEQDAAHQIATLVLMQDTYEDPTVAGLKGFGAAVAGTGR
jgi:hypothetical protein